MLLGVIPKKFWRNIKGLLENKEDCDVVAFKEPSTGMLIDDNNVPNFLNDFFANISDRVCDAERAKVFIPGPACNSNFLFIPPEQYEITLLAEDIDVNSASGIEGINTKISKCLILHIPSKFRLLFANSMFTGYFPYSWTLSRVKLIPKSGDLSNPNNWRPISMTNVFAKILEKLVHTQLLKYLMDQQLISKHQFGFVPGKSTHEAVFKVVQYIYSALNNKKLTGMLLLDISKAFNCISHEVLYSKMFMAGFDISVVQWFRSYLHRTQQLSINGRLSSIIPVANGIAQGTVLGPILFIFYINDVLKTIKHVKMSLFADECVLYLSGNNWDIIRRKIQSDFESVIEWTLCNNLRLNQSKTKAMIFGSRYRLSNLVEPTPLKMSGDVVNFVKHYSYLGIMLDSVMSLSPLVKSVKKKVSNKIYMFRKIRKYLDFKSAVIVYKQTILPVIDYPGFLLLACNSGDLDDIQILQNDILRICNKSKISDRVSIPILHEKCKIISLKQRMHKQLLGLMYVLSKQADYVKVAQRNTRSAEKVIFKVPNRILPIYEHSPYYQGTTLWNGLDKEVQHKDTLFAFKKAIEPLFKRYVAM